MTLPSKARGTTSNYVCPAVEEIDQIIKIKDWDNKPKSLEALVRTGDQIINFTVDTGSTTSFVNKSTSDIILADKSTNANFVKIEDLKLRVTYIDYNKKKINILGAVFADISSAGWKVKRARFLVVEKKKCLLGMDLHRNLGIRTTQISAPKEEAINEVSSTTTDD